MENTITLNSGQKIEVLLQDEVSLDIDCALRYIKSGKQEIDAYIKTSAQPHLDNVINQAQASMEVKIAKGIDDAAEAAAAAAVREISSAKEEIDDYTRQYIMPEMNNVLTNAENMASIAVARAQNASESSEAAAESVLEAQAGADKALASAVLAENWAEQAEEIARKISNGMSLFDIKWSDHLLNNMSWLRADTFSWQSGTVYVAAYNELMAEYNNEDSEEKTEGNITFKHTPKGYKIAPASQEEAVLELYTATGVAWYYIVDAENQRFKLPRTKYGFTGLRNSAGNFVEESLPNIKGQLGGNSSQNQVTIGNVYDSTFIATEAFSASNLKAFSGFNTGGGGYSRGMQINFDASNVSPAYQNNAPVQPRATQMYLYFYIGDYNQPAIEQTAGLKADMFNDKADISLANITSAAKEAIVKWGIPDYTAGIDVSAEFVDNSYWTASKAGWYVIVAGDSSYFDIRARDEGRYIIASAPATPSAVSSGIFMADIGQRLFVTKKSGLYAIAIYYPFKGGD